MARRSVWFTQYGGNSPWWEWRHSTCSLILGILNVLFVELLGGNIAASWVTLKHLGQDGYMKIARQLMDTTEKLITGIKDIPVRFHICYQTFASCSFYDLLCLVRGALMFKGFVYSGKAAYDVIRNCVRWSKHWYFGRCWWPWRKGKNISNVLK